MRQTQSSQWSFIAAPLAVAGLLWGWPTASAAQSVAGDARGLLVSPANAILSVVADTGPLVSTNDLRDAAAGTGSVPSVVGGEVLSAVTMGWPDEVDSVASLAGLGFNVGGTGISADFVMATATATLAGVGSFASNVVNLSVNGVPISVTGEVGQIVPIPGGHLVINEQTVSADGSTTVNALHATIAGLLGNTDVVVASATAGIR